MAPVVFLIMVDLRFTKGGESIGSSIAHEMRVPPIGEACIERREHCASVIVGGIVSGKVRVG